MRKFVKHKKVKKFASVPLMLIIIFTLIVAYSLFLFILLFPDCRNQLIEQPFALAIGCFFTGFLPIVLVICTARRCFTLLVIDEKGITTSLFHFFYRRVFKWDEITEIMYYERLIPFLFVSKNVYLTEMDYDEIIKRKDVLQISLTPKIYKAITNFTDRPIVGLTEDKIEKLKLDE